MGNDARTAWTSATDTASAIEALVPPLTGTTEPGVILFFCAPTHDGAALSKALRERFPTAEVVGCTTSGEFSNAGNGVGGVSAIALTQAHVKRGAATIVPLDTTDPGEIDARIRSACNQLGTALGIELRSADRRRYVGILLVDSARGLEEDVNEALGNAAPLLTFVGGSAGDNLVWKQTSVFHNGAVSALGAVLLLMEMAAPFTILKTCSYAPTDRVFCVTKADPARRVVYEFDGRSAVEVYCEATGIKPGDLNATTMGPHPVGLMIDGEPWIRALVGVTGNGGLQCACRIIEGMEVNLMRATDPISDTQKALDSAKHALGSDIAGAVMFNCAGRRLAFEAAKLTGAYHALFANLKVAGFHTHGESLLGHINFTLTSLVIGHST